MTNPYAIYKEETEQASTSEANPYAETVNPYAEFAGQDEDTEQPEGKASIWDRMNEGGLLSKDSEIGKLSPEKQAKWLGGQIEKSEKQIAKAEAAIAKYKPQRDKYEPGTVGYMKARNKLVINQGRLKAAQDRLNIANSVFAGETPLPEYGKIKNAAAGGVKAFNKAFMEDIPKGVAGIQATITGQDPAETAAYKFGEAQGQKADEAFYTDPAYSADTAQQVAQGVGQAGSFFTPGVVAKSLGLPGKAASRSAMGFGAIQTGVGGLDDAVRLEGTTKQQLISFWGNSALGLSEALPVNKLLGRLNQTTGGQIDRIVRNSAASSAEELMQEIGQTIGSNAIASELARYDEGRELLKGTFEAGKVGGFVGALLGAGGAAVTRGPEQGPRQQAPEMDTYTGDDVTPTAPEAGGDVEAGNQDIEPAAPIRAKPIKKGVAFDTENGRTEVEYAIVELDDLITSHGDTMDPNPLYPQALQPRDRSRKSSETQVQDIFAKFQPERMGETAEAGSGSPIISANGVVESGNGRTMGLRRVYQENGEKAAAYRKFLQDSGYKPKGFNQPVLVRIADPNRTDAERVAFTRRANADVTAAMSVTERGIADARSLSPQDFDLAKDGGVETAGNTPFVRQVLTKVTTEAERGKLIDPSGKLSVDGKRRVEAAVASYAYEDPRVLSDLIETTDSTLRSIGDAMISAAPKWASLRADVEAGRVDERVNIVPQIIEAANIVSDARSTGATVDERIAAIKDDMFNDAGEVDQVTQDILKIFYDPKSLKQRKPKDIADALSYYAQEAAKVQAGPDIFGDRSDDNPARRILDAALKRVEGKKTQDEDFEKSAPTESVFLPEGFELDAETDSEQQTDDKTAPLFDKAPKTDSAAFKRWFDGSKVVDDDGKPLVVHHGGLGVKSLEEFSKNYAGQTDRR